MHARRGVGRNQVLVGVAVVAVLALITVPLWLSWSKKSKRGEVMINVEEIRTAELAYKDAFSDYVSARAAPRAPHEVDPNPVPWTSNRGFDKLGWKPQTSSVRGSYTVDADRKGFLVIGTCDVDGDGKRVRVEAKHDAEATTLSDASVF